ncbi:WecB/TagA/CpsF family glycosyltransferase [Microbacterium aurantiacum]|uniref:WecB/TagA/CpsF family glycosyltransferase n=1 Tax=Microbacterium aurantiacum TaxID=162393 RepID=UPI003D758034
MNQPDVETPGATALRKPSIIVDNGTARIGGSRLFAGTMDELVDLLFDKMRRLEEPQLLITVNVDQILLLKNDADWRRVFASAKCHTADGMPVVFLSRALGARNLNRLTGADLLVSASESAAKTGARVALVGGSDSVRGRAESILRQKARALSIAGFGLPLLASADDPQSAEAVQRLREFRPDIVFICLGAPKQELWFEHWREDLPAAMYVGAGASMDFVAGRARRAPLWAQRVGAEWVFRLAQEPRRLAHRYLIRGPQFATVILRSLASARRKKVVSIELDRRR